MFLDMHIVHALANGWLVYRDSLDAFSELFPGVSSTHLAEWHALVNANHPVFRAAFAPGTPEAFPVVSVELMSEIPAARYLGNSGGVMGTRRVVGFRTKATAEITLLSKRDDLTRVLARITQAVLLRAVPSFLASGYVSLQYEGAGELSLDELLVGEEMGIYTRRLTYSAEAELHIPEQQPGVVLDVLPWFVQLGEVEEDPDRAPVAGAGVPGGVTTVAD